MSIARHLNHAFQTFFTSYSKDWVDLVLELFEECGDVLLADVHRKYPAAVAGRGFDAELAEIMETDATIQAVFLYRVSHALFLRDKTHPALRYLAYLMRARSGAELYYSAEIGPGLMLQHGMGTVVGPRHKIGSHFTIYQGVTLGQRQYHGSHEFITIGDHCMVFAGAKVLGTVVIGSHTLIAANAVLLSDALPNSTYAGVPARRIVTK